MGAELPLYLDYHATTPVDPRVLEAMQPFFTRIFGNPASAAHVFGWQAAEAVKIAREGVARLIGAEDPKEIVWTSGTTEAINLAMIGVAERYREKGDHLITCVTEHRAVLETAAYLEGRGFRVTRLPVNQDGRVDPDAVARAVTPKTILISILMANNEVGTIQPAAEIGRIAKEKGVLFHADAAQACGKYPVNVARMGIDLLSMSAHKVYGPKGIGALYVRRKNPRVLLAPLIHGGGQEEGLRAGTLAVPNIVGMGKCFDIAAAEMGPESCRIAGLRNRLYKGLIEKIDGVSLNGPPLEGPRLPGNLNVSFDGVPAGDLMAKLSDVAVSSGSACASGSREPSYVILALGVGEERAKSSIRFGLGRMTTEGEIDETVDRVSKAVRSLR